MIHLANIRGQKSVIDLPREHSDWRKIITFSIISLLGLILLYVSIEEFIQDLLYNNIFFLLIIALIILITTIGILGFINEGFYRHPILVLTTNHIFIGSKALFQSPKLKDSGINPLRDISLVIVKDSRTKKYRLFLEGRKLIQLGTHRQIEIAELQRKKIQKKLALFYPKIYVSQPLYQNTKSEIE